MKRVICAAFILLLLTACSQYAEPDVNSLMEQILSEQTIEEVTVASEADISILFDIDLSAVDVCDVRYSGKGGYADIIAIFKLKDISNAETVINMLIDYKAGRYEDFIGYAPFEAEKIEKGRVMAYGRYVLLVVVPDISAAQKTIDAAFEA